MILLGFLHVTGPLKASPGEDGRWKKTGDGGRTGGEEVGEADPSLWGGVGEGEEGRSCQTRGEDLVSVPSNSSVWDQYVKDKP